MYPPKIQNIQSVPKYVDMCDIVDTEPTEEYDRNEMKHHLINYVRGLKQ